MDGQEAERARGKKSMRTGIKTLKTAKKVCLELWKLLEERCTKNKEYDMTHEKAEVLEELGYAGLNGNCPMCAYHNTREETHCSDCSLHNCFQNGFHFKMTRKGIKKFNEFIKDTLGTEE